MRIQEKEIILKDGRSVLLRSPGPEDAAAVEEHRRVTSEETYFMARYPEERQSDVEAMGRWISALSGDPREVGISAFCDGKLVGDCLVSTLRPHLKYRHRASFGISIRKEFWGQGLGSLLLAEAIRAAGENGFEQLELGVFTDNVRAIALYEKMGFQKVGIQPRAFQLKDGTYRDEVMMVRFL